MKHGIVILVNVDALRCDYVGADASYLNQLGQLGIAGELVPSFGFEPDAAFLAGLHPDQANGGAQFWCDPKTITFPFTRACPALLDRMPCFAEKVLRRLITLWARRQCPSPQLSTARIPFELLHHFTPSARVGLDQPGFSPRPTVFDLLRASAKRWLYHGVPARGLTMSFALRRAEAALFPPIEFAYFHVGDLDRVGHTCGPDSPERFNAMLCVDEGLKRLHTLATRRFEQVHFVVFGDHGMATVTCHLNVQAMLRPLPCRLGPDYLMFLDSTMARFWFFDERARAHVWEALGGLGGGHWISQEEKGRYHLNYKHNRFGDEIFLVDPGVLILPNFYQGDQPVCGMHGYAPETPEQQSALMLHSPRIREPRLLDTPQDMRRLFPTLLELLDLPVPAGLEVQSLLRESDT
jgi:hypothetical protein